jgi:PilZ domain
MAILDLVLVEPRRDASIIVSLPGQYSLASKRDLRGAPRTLSCRAISVSVDEIALMVPVQSWVGDQVRAEVQHLGMVRGPLIRLHGENVIVLAVDANPAQRRNLAGKIEWIDKFKNLDVPDQRSDARFTPKNPVTIAILADGSCLPCFIIDLSTSGASISADFAPKLGTVLAIGRIVGRVVRHLAGGFGVRFVHKQDRRTVEAQATRR